jgi:hypothetical protein
VIMKILNEEPPHPRFHNPRISRRQEAICLKVLERTRPAARGVPPS